MARVKNKSAGVRCYPAKSKALTAVGIALVALGALLILILVPYWAWLALIGAAMIILGILILRK